MTIIIALAAVGLLVVVLIPRRTRVPALEQPAAPKPAFRVVETIDMSARGIGRASVTALVRADMPEESLRPALDWLIYDTRAAKPGTRVVWGYLLTDSLAGKVNWRALAIWTDPRLPERLRPAGMGGDATKQGSTEYDLTNTVRPPDSTKER